MVAELERIGGDITRKDLADYRAVLMKPTRASLMRGKYDVYSASMFTRKDTFT